MQILVIDIGGNNVKLYPPGRPEELVKIPTGPAFTPQQLVAEVTRVAQEWSYDVIAVGYPGVIRDGRPGQEPKNLGRGWAGFDFSPALGRPVRLINDAALQALGGYTGGTLLFLGLGTGLGSALVANHQVIPLELAHLPYRKGRTFEDYAGERGLKRLGTRRWRGAVTDILHRLRDALVADDVLLAGGNARKMKELPEFVRRGDNRLAYLGGLRLWDQTANLPNGGPE